MTPYDLPPVLLPPEVPPPGRWQRLRIWLNALFVDLAIFRIFYTTRRAVTPDFHRSGHPFPYQLRRAARDGVKSVLSLRGPEVHVGTNRLEWEACAETGLKIVHLPLGSRSPPERGQVLRLMELFETLERPLLVHCKSGADRAGMVSVMFLATQKGIPLEAAMHEMDFWRHGHLKQAKTGVLDHFFEAYQSIRDSPGPLHGIGFMDWVRDHYDRKAVEDSFHSSWWANQLVDFVLRRE